jgi:isochorismate synthase EntC
MANVRSHNANAENNDVENNNAANPPPQPTLEQVVVMQAQMLKTM